MEPSVKLYQLDVVVMVIVKSVLIKTWISNTCVMKVTHYGSPSRQGTILIPYSSCFDLHLCIIIIKWSMKKILNASRDSYTYTRQYTIVDIITFSKCDLTIVYFYIE